MSNHRIQKRDDLQDEILKLKEEVAEGVKARMEDARLHDIEARKLFNEADNLREEIIEMKKVKMSDDNYIKYLKDEKESAQKTMWNLTNSLNKIPHWIRRIFKAD